MCGVLALLQSARSDYDGATIVNKMLLPLRESRGPDAGAFTEVFANHSSKLFFAHARLSIIDLNERSHQPMCDPQTGFALVYNGEIYNYKKLKSQLSSSYNFITESDTEVLLAGLQIWGLEKTLERLKGMFAFCAFDPRNNEMWLARDRAGEKPLSYGKVGDDWVITSDLRVLNYHPGWSREISLEGLRQYFTYRFVPHPHSLYVGFNKLEPGHFVKMSLNDQIAPKSQAYWSIWDEWKSSDLSFKNISLQECYGEVVRRFAGASDVPMGCFLSGGVDSSLVASLLSRVTDQPIQAFTIRFEEKEFDESEQAKKIAEKLGFKYWAVDFGYEEFCWSFKKLIHYLDEPTAVHSFYPLGYLSKFAKEHVKVCFSGDGGDELYGGYNRHVFWQNYMERVLKWPSLSRKTLKSLFDNPLAKSTFKKLNLRQAEDKYEKILSVLSTQDMNSYYRQLLTYESPLGQAYEGFEFVKKENIKGMASVERMMAYDFQFYLPNDVLNKVDRATMAFGLEARAPFLDIDSIRKALCTPINEKIAKGQSKFILKQWLKEIVPGVDHNQPKSGFTTPLVHWMDRLMVGRFKEQLRGSSLFPFLESPYREELLQRDQFLEEHFIIFTVLSWLEANDIRISS